MSREFIIGACEALTALDKIKKVPRFHPVWVGKYCLIPVDDTKGEASFVICTAYSKAEGDPEALQAELAEFLRLESDARMKFCQERGALHVPDVEADEGWLRLTFLTPEDLSNG